MQAAGRKPFFADAAYVNFLGEVTEEGVRTAYGNKYPRLAALKAKYDPTNFFCFNQNIKPKSAATSIGRSVDASCRKVLTCGQSHKMDLAELVQRP